MVVVTVRLSVEECLQSSLGKKAGGAARQSSAG